MNITWDNAQTFIAVAETGSFSAAAKKLGIKQPTVSRRIAELEEHTGGPLFHRGRRGTKVSSAGEKLLPAARAMALYAKDFELLLSEYSDVPKGTVRIAAPPGVALDVLAPFAKRLREEEPDIRLEILSGIDAVDLTHGDADLALRTQGPPREKDLECIWKFEADVAAYASEEYEQSLPAGATLQDIDWITFSHPFEHLPPGPQLAEIIAGFKPVFSSNSFIIQLEAASRGIGAMFLPKGLHGNTSARRLVLLDIDTPKITGWVYLIASKRARWVPRVKAVADALTRYLNDTIIQTMGRE